MLRLRSMFTIIGGDGKEYGPATADQIKAWMAAGRANFDTKARAVGTDDWRRLADFPEFMPASDVPPPIAEIQPGAVVVSDETELAERITRLGAWFLDNVIAFLCMLPGTIILGFSVVSALLLGEGDLGDLTSGRVVLGWVLLATFGFALLIVQVWLLTTRGQTIGKKLMGIRIVRLTDESNPGFVSAVLVRAVLPAIIGMVPYFGFLFTIVDVCFIFRDDRRCVHDLMAGTKVVKVT